MGRVFPLQGWAFIIGFLVFPLWWVAAAAPVGWGWPRDSVGGRNGKSALSDEDLMAQEVIKFDGEIFAAYALNASFSEV